MTQFKTIRHKVKGRLFLQTAQNGLLWLDEAAAGVVYLRYALVTIGREDEIFPALLLDDWGNEMRKLDVYRWIREEGDLFPRAELFGYDRQGQEEQCFLREMELHLRLPCYAYLDAETPLAEGVRLVDMMLPQPDLAAPERIKPPDFIKPPLSYARLNWWQGPSTGPAQLGYTLPLTPP